MMFPESASSSNHALISIEFLHCSKFWPQVINWKPAVNRQPESAIWRLNDEIISREKLYINCGAKHSLQYGFLCSSLKNDVPLKNDNDDNIFILNKKELGLSQNVYVNW